MNKIFLAIIPVLLTAADESNAGTLTYLSASHKAILSRATRSISTVPFAPIEGMSSSTRDPLQIHIRT